MKNRKFIKKLEFNKKLNMAFNIRLNENKIRKYLIIII